MASSSRKDLFKDKEEDIISNQNSDSIGGESLGGIKMGDYQTAVKLGLDDEEQDDGGESQRLIEEGDISSPGIIEFDELKSERYSNNTS